MSRPADGRGNLWVSLDGHKRFELCANESLLVTGSHSGVNFVTNTQNDLTVPYSMLTFTLGRMGRTTHQTPRLEQQTTHENPPQTLTIQLIKT